MLLGTEVGLGRDHTVLDVDRAPPKKAHSCPLLAAPVYCSQTAGWIKMPLRREVDLGSGDIVLDGDPVPPSLKGAQPLFFDPCLLWPNGWIGPDRLVRRSASAQATLC